MFSVSDTKKVRFSRGKLKATLDETGAVTAWSFHEHQQDTVQYNSSEVSYTSADLDLFRWSGDESNNWGIVSMNQSYADTTKVAGVFKDWGANPALIEAWAQAGVH